MDMILTGNFLHYNSENLNGHIYSEDAVESIINQFKERKKSGQPLYGCLGFPENTIETPLRDVSHVVENLEIDASLESIVGSIRILDTDAGKLVKEIVDKDCQIFCRSRGIGSVDPSGFINDDFKLISFDIVNGPDAFDNICPEDFLNKQFEDDE